METRTITYHASLNNGSFFQAYALQQTLLRLGYENRILDIQCDALKRDYELFRKPSSLGDIAKNVISFIHFKSLKIRTQKFAAARKKYLSLTDEYSKLSDYVRATSDTDSVYIAGSDQIWNVSASDFTDDYFLPKIKNKIAFSVSGGSNITKIELERKLNAIREFQSISVRETDLQRILTSFGIESVFTVDPTLLLAKKDYLKLVSPQPYIKGKYIFLYTVKCNPRVLKMAKRISKHLNMPVYTLFNTFRSEKNVLYGIHNIYDAGPFDFLNLIHNATLVLTDSFHGTVFSVIIEKEFYYIADVNEKGQPQRDDRIDDFLQKVDMTTYTVSVMEPETRIAIGHKYYAI